MRFSESFNGILSKKYFQEKHQKNSRLNQEVFKESPNSFGKYYRGLGHGSAAVLAQQLSTSPSTKKVSLPNFKGKGREIFSRRFDPERLNIAEQQLGFSDEYSALIRRIKSALSLENRHDLRDSIVQVDKELSQKNPHQNTPQQQIAFEGFPYLSNFVELSNDLNIHYLDEGSGDPIVLLHGVPTSSYLWRDIIPELATRGRVIVPDLINFGLSDKTEDPLSFVEHGQLFGEFVDTLDLEDITFVGHDWGGPIGLNYIVDNPDNVEALAFFESPIVPLPNVDALRALPGNFFDTFIDPANSASNIVDENLFIEGYLFNPEFGGVAESPTDAEKTIYRDPFSNAEDRDQLLSFPLEIPLLNTTGHPVYDPDGVGGLPPEPVPNIAEFLNFANYLSTTDIPRLLIAGTPGFAPADVVLPLAEAIPGLEVQTVGDEINNPAFHFLQEDVPEQLSEVLGAWIDSTNAPPEPEPPSATTLQITVENLAPENGIGFAALWFGLHDGSFDTFNPDDPASEALEFLFEDGLVGLEEAVLPGILEDIIAAGLDPAQLPLSIQQALTLGLDLPTLPPPPGTLAGEFLLDPAGANGGTQGMVVTSIRTNPELFDLLDDPSAFPQNVLDSVTNPFFFIQASGETETFTVTLNGTPEENRYFSFASMLFPTNDGFIGNDDPEAIEIFDASGNFVGADFIVTGADAWDGGTEVNDEAPESLLYTFEAFGDGIDEGGTIQPFPGFRPPGDGGALDFEFNGNLVAENADFSSTDPIARITVTAVDAPEVPTSPELEPDFGTDGDDILEVANSNELVFAGAGNDLIDASPSQGGNRIFGGAGNDTFILGTGDVSAGGEENDRFFNQAGGENQVAGGTGADQFWIAVADLPGVALVITDFELEADVIGIAGIGASSAADLSFSQEGDSAIISFGNTDLAVLRGIESNSLEQNATFAFV
ncbi:Haloalkane dehalogenase [Acaryochloris thomasi RCC1774]|uniref:Haloalkane dehalogenase n=1 Tax=Acaryochloris thomasi RCC1774 TaxID=1764569 RepID=A0A2W1K093_9CYAN|nr:alpha/beta fold hydrolase [Acaryochloris thomasi]PZD74071.1 Haloalkane dehalogenase [Acaryochloris thomasi RCC1774]